MAEIYPVGQNRIFYRPRGFSVGLAVKVEMIDPSLVVGELIELNELEGKGLYYFEYPFLVEGTYIGVFYENDIKITSQSFSTRKLNANIGSTTFLGGVYRGPNVL